MISGVFLGIQTTLVTELVGLSCVARASGVLFAFISIASLTATPFSGISNNVSLLKSRKSCETRPLLPAIK